MACLMAGMLGCGGGQMFPDDPTRGGVNPGVGDLVEPLAELTIQVVAVAETATKEEILPRFMTQTAVEDIYDRLGKRPATCVPGPPDETRRAR